MGLLDDLLDAGKDVAQQQLGQLLQQLGQEDECGRFGVIVWCGVVTLVWPSNCKDNSSNSLVGVMVVTRISRVRVLR